MIESIHDFHFEENGHKYVSGGKDHPSVTGLLKKYRFVDYSMVNPEVLERKRILGTLLHKWTMDHDLTGNDDMLGLPEEAEGYAEGWMNFRRQSGFELIKVERPLMGSILGVMVGGTPDRQMRMKRIHDLVLDLKFCASPMPSWALQTAAYSMLITRKTNIDRVKRCCAQIMPNGRYKIHWHENSQDADTFLHMISIEAWLQTNGLKG